MPIHYEQDSEHVVLITIDRPEARNAADMEHFKALREAWERFAADAGAWSPSSRASVRRSSPAPT